MKTEIEASLQATAGQGDLFSSRKLLKSCWLAKNLGSSSPVECHFRIDANTAKKYCEFVVFVVLPAVLPPVSNLSFKLEV